MQIKCPQCGFSQNLNENTIPPTAVNARCPQCDTRFKFRELPFSAARSHDEVRRSAPDDARNEGESAEEYAARRKAAADAYAQAARAGVSFIEWEGDIRANPVKAFARTLWQAVSQPSRFFLQVPYSSNLSRPVAFALLLCVLRTAIVLATLRHQLNAFVELQPEYADSVQALLNIPWWMYALASLALFFCENGLIALASHATMRFLAPRAANLRTTVRVVAYANAGWILCLIPQIGFSLGFVALLVLLCLGLRAAHRLSLTVALSSTLASLFMLVFVVMALASSSRLIISPA